KFPFPFQDLDIVMLTFQLTVIMKNFLIGTVIFHYDNFKIPVGGFFIDGINASFQILPVVFISDDNGYQRISLYGQFCPVSSPVFCHAYFCLYSQPVVMSLYRCTACLIGIHFTFWISCRGGRMISPMIQYFRNMTDLLCLLAAAEDKVIILSTVIFFP